MSRLVIAYCYLNIEAVWHFICVFEIIKVDGPQNALLNVFMSYAITEVFITAALTKNSFRRDQM